MPAYTPLQSIVLTSSASSVTFSNIPQTYQDLVLVVNPSGVGANTDENCSIQVNGDTTSTYSMTRIRGNGSTATSDRETSATSATAGIMTVKATANGTTDSYIINFLNYSNSTTYKSWISCSSSAAYAVQSMVCLWRSTNAINSIKFKINSNNFGAGSTFDLYGISPVAAQNASATGGTDIFYDSTYVYHVFKGSGTFTPARALSADILVVAGGGGSGGSANVDKGSAGGGAGGLLGFTSQSLTANTSYAVVVGAGGTCGTATSGAATQGANGSDSQFASLTLVKGGGGSGAGNPGPGSGSNAPWAGLNGGSGGGSTGGGTAGTATSGQGNNGGASADSSPYGGSGGGGAGAAGQAMGSGGAGGAGSSTYSSWGSATGTGQNVSSTYYYAGGGGGGVYSVATPGSGGNGGGGAGGAQGAQGSSGLTNTGGGAGGTGGNTTQHSGNNGGSGIVIVRYAR